VHVLLASAASGLVLAEATPLLLVGTAVVPFVLLARTHAALLGAIVSALVLGGALVGDLRLAAIDSPAGRVRDGERVDLRAHLLSAPRHGPFGATAEVEVGYGRLRDARLLVRVPRWSPLPGAARPGAELRLEGSIAALGGDHFAAYLRRRGIAGELRLERARLTGDRRGGIAGLLDGLRARAERGVKAGMAPDEAALLRGMVLGQDERISAAVREDFRASGLAHLLAVSGQNVMLLAALALPLLMFAGCGLRARLAVLAALVAVYVPLAGAGPSLQRAGVMGLAGIAAMAASRPASRSYALLLAAVATLAWNPRAWSDPGWQLSFAAVVGILALGVPLARVLRKAVDELIRPSGSSAGFRGPRTRLAASGLADAPALTPSAGLASHAQALADSRPNFGPRVLGAGPKAVRLGGHALADGIAITLAATTATAPLLAHHFDAVPLAGLPANLFALPFVAPAMWLGMLKIAAGQLAVPDFVAAGLGALAELPVGVISWLAERFADLPAGQLAVPLRSPMATGAVYAGMAVAVLALWRAARRVAPRAIEALSRWRRLPRGTRAGLAAVVAVALVLAAGWGLQRPPTPDRLTVRFLDVGQGDATLIQHPDGTAVLFDGGPPEAGVARLLRRAGVRRLALVVATHASRDHHGGLVEVLRRFPVDVLLDGGDGATDHGFAAVRREAEARGTRVIRATAPLTLGLAGGGLRVDVLSPDPRPPGSPPEDPNPRAVIAVVSSGWFDVLLSADAESEALLPLDLPDVDAMKVPHHGSADPGLPEVLDELDPELAAIEVGPNTYGHPTPSTIAALSAAGVRTYRTDRDGTVTITIDRQRMHVATER
jgi:competence protein ComEC